MENIISEFINNIKENNIQAVNEMLDKNPSLLYSEDEISHPAFFVAANTSLDMTMLFLNRGIDINQSDNLDRNALFYSHNLDVIKYLVEKGIDINHEDGSYYTALFLQMRSNDFQIFEYLIDNGAYCEKKWYGGRFIHYALSFIDKDNDVLFDFFCSKCNVNILDKNGNNCISYVLKSGNIHWIEKLAALGNSYYNVNNDGNNLLHLAMRYKAPINVIEFLLKQNISLTEKNKRKEDVMMVLAQHGRYNYKEYLKIFKMFKKYDSSFNISDYNRNDVIEKANLNSNYDFIDALCNFVYTN